MSTRKTFIIGDPNDPAKRFYVDSSTNHVGMNVYPDDGYTLFVNQETHAESGAAKFSGDVLIDDASLNVEGTITVDKIGIGTINPENDLHLEGNTRLNGLVGIGTGPNTSAKLRIYGGNLYVNEDISANNDLFVNNDADIAGNLTVNGNLNVDNTIAVGSITDLEDYVIDISTNLSNLSQNKIEDTGSSTDVTVGTSEVAFNIGYSQPLIAESGSNKSSLTIDTDDVTIKRITTSDLTYFLAINSVEKFINTKLLEKFLVKLHHWQIVQAAVVIILY